ncbi:MAG: hypothetical protein QF476_07065, partial [Dehalococcoidia bacterium]|nr:hypothetical protein [Dehalococcoidia bacterium]
LCNKEVSRIKCLCRARAQSLIDSDMPVDTAAELSSFLRLFTVSLYTLGVLQNMRILTLIRFRFVAFDSGLSESDSIDCLKILHAGMINRNRFVVKQWLLFFDASRFDGCFLCDYRRPVTDDGVSIVTPRAYRYFGMPCRVFPYRCMSNLAYRNKASWPDQFNFGISDFISPTLGTHSSYKMLTEGFVIVRL